MVIFSYQNFTKASNMKCTLFLQGFAAKPHDCTFFATRNTFRPDLFLLSFLRSMYSSMSMRLGIPTRYIIFGASYDCLLHQNQKIHKSNLSPFKYQAWNKHTLVESSLTSVSIVLRSIQPQFNMFKNIQKWIHKIKFLGYSSAYSWLYSNESNLLQNSNWWTAKKSPKGDMR